MKIELNTSIEDVEELSETFNRLSIDFFGEKIKLDVEKDKSLNILPGDGIQMVADMEALKAANTTQDVLDSTEDDINLYRSQEKYATVRKRI